MMDRWIWGAILITLATPAAADSCDALMAAYDKEAHTPHRYVNTVVHDGKVETELTDISVGGKTFIKMSGMFSSVGWAVNAWDPDKDVASFRQFTAKNQPTCRADGTETVDGDLADIIVSVNANGFTTRLWVSRATGLPVKEEGEPKDGRTVHATYSYTDITAPDTN
jgi:hypothetical protein